MNSVKSWLLEQFPNYEHHIHELWGVDKGFEAKSHEFYELQRKLSNGAEPVEMSEVDALKSRRNALRDELMFLMGANLR